MSPVKSTSNFRLYAPPLINTTGAVQAGCCQVPISAADIIFIEKRRSYPASLSMHTHCWSLGRTCNVFLTKMDALLPKANFEDSPPALLRAPFRNETRIQA